MERAHSFAELVERLRDLNERLERSKTTNEKRAILREFQDVLTVGEEMLDGSS